MATRSLTDLDHGTIARLAASFSGHVILPGDKQYQAARRVWNHAVNAYPSLIAQCANPTDVMRAVEFARRHDLLTAVRTGGHSFAGHGVCDGGIVIDLSLMKKAAIDPAQRLVTIEAGVLAGELDCITQAYKLAVPLGSCPSVGVSGYSLGGGEGSLTPRFGYGCDSINGLDVITADGRLHRASDKQNADLFWAMRGAGANFGIATSIEFLLHPVDIVLSGHLKYPLRQASKVLHFLDSYVGTIPDDLYLIAAVLPYPGERMLDIAVVWPGDEKTGARAVHPLRRFLKPQEDTIKTNPYLEEQRSGSGTPGDGAYASHRKTGHFKRLSPAIVEVVTQHASNAPTEASGISMIYWHGPWCSRPRDVAFGFRRTGFEYWIHSYWKKAGERGRCWDWVERFAAAMAPLSSGAAYVNGIENEDEEVVIAAYGDKYDRLARLKRKYDPDNFFRVNQNIRPAK